MKVIIKEGENLVHSVNVVKKQNIIVLNLKNKGIYTSFKIGRKNEDMYIKTTLGDIILRLVLGGLKPTFEYYEKDQIVFNINK